MSGRPRPRSSRTRSVAASTAGTPSHRGVLDRRDLLDPQADRRGRRGVPAGTRSGASAAVPTDSRGTTIEPGVEGVMVDRDGVQALADLEGDRLAVLVDRRPAASRPRAGCGPVAGRAAGGRRPRTLPRHRSARGRATYRGGPAASARARRRARSGRRPAADRPGSGRRRAQDRDADGERDETDGHEDEGGHGGDATGAGHGKARRNLHDTWALMRSPPLVSFGPSGLPSTLRARRRHGQPWSSTNVGGSCRVIHRPSTRRATCSVGRAPPSPGPARSPGRRSR